MVFKKNDKIIKKLTLSTRDMNYTKLNRLFINFVVDYKKVKKILFCSVVPKSFNVIKKFLSKKARLKCYEVKDLNLKSLIKIKANYKQVGSDRLTNAISLVNNTNNFIILDFGTATTFDVLIKNIYSHKPTSDLIKIKNKDIVSYKEFYGFKCEADKSVIK